MVAGFLGFTRIQIATVPPEWNALFGHNRIPFEFCRMGHFLSRFQYARRPSTSRTRRAFVFARAYSALPLLN